MMEDTYNFELLLLNHLLSNSKLLSASLLLNPSRMHNLLPTQKILASTATSSRLPSTKHDHLITSHLAHSSKRSEKLALVR